MKYFTMDELNEITNEILDNPSKDTLRSLYEKYCYDGQLNDNNGWIETSNNNILGQTNSDIQQQYDEVTNILPQTDLNQVNDNVPYTNINGNNEQISEPNSQNISYMDNLGHDSLLPIDEIKGNDVNIQNNNMLGIYPFSSDEKKQEQASNDVLLQEDSLDDKITIDNGSLNIEPYHNQNVDIQLPNQSNEKSIIGTIEESIGKDKKITEKPPILSDQKKNVEILPYKDFINTKASASSINLENNLNIQNNPVGVNNHLKPSYIAEENSISNNGDNIINNMMQTTDNFNATIESFPTPSSQLSATPINPMMMENLSSITEMQ